MTDQETTSPTDETQVRELTPVEIAAVSGGAGVGGGVQVLLGDGSVRGLRYGGPVGW